MPYRIKGESILQFCGKSVIKKNILFKDGDKKRLFNLISKTKLNCSNKNRDIIHREREREIKDITEKLSKS